MSLIYEPKGKAREYSPLALNVYTMGCEHQCNYCYCKNITSWSIMPNVRDLTGLAREAQKTDRQILLSFMSDPYAPIEATQRNTRIALSVLKEARCSVAILTKGGTRCLDDLDMFSSWPDNRIKVGATLTFISESKSLQYEPGAALPQNRIDALQCLSENGIMTWASIEPVIDPQESLAVIEASLPYVDAYKVGRLNHVKNTTDWNAFGTAAVTMIRNAGKRLYVKDDLRASMTNFLFTDAESNHESLTLPDRPLEAMLL